MRGWLLAQGVADCWLAVRQASKQGLVRQLIAW